MKWITPPSLYLLRWMPPIVVAVEYVVIVLIAALSGAAAAYGPRLEIANDEVRRKIFTSAAVAIWTAPLMILILDRSALTGVVGAGMVVAAFSVMGINAQDDDDFQAYSGTQSVAIGASAEITEALRFSRRLAIMIVASALLQAAGIANIIAEREIALGLFVFAAALFAAQLPEKHLEPAPTMGNSRIGTRVSLSIVLAIAFVLVGMLPALMSSGQETSLDALLRSLFLTKPAGSEAHSRSLRVQQAPIRSDGYIGVILTPRRQKLRAVEVPHLTLHARNATMHQLTIPFSGAYWFFQQPFVRPPLDSVTTEGDPSSVGVRSSNYKPLMMEAVQTLEEAIDASKLSQIQLSLLDEDPYPGTVSVELLLIDTSAWNHPSRSLGIERVNTTARIENATSSHSETLTFTIPPHSRKEYFNQICLMFRLDPSRNREGAAIAIQSFVLVPTGI